VGGAGAVSLWDLGENGLSDKGPWARGPVGPRLVGDW